MSAESAAPGALVDTDFGYGGAISVMLVVLCLVTAGVVMRVMRPSEVSSS